METVHADAKDDLARAPERRAAAPEQPQRAGLLPLQRAAGNRAVSQLVAGQPLRVQRAVGFEFESGKWTLEQLNRPLTAGELDGTNSVHKSAFKPLKKGDALHQGTNFKLTPDEGTDQEVGGSSFHIEFVTDPFQETTDGRKQLKTAMKELKGIADKLVKSRSGAHVRRPKRAMPRIPASEVVPGMGADVLVTPWDTMSAEAQMTAGIRLDELGGLLEALDPDKKTGESDKQHRLRGQGAMYLSGKKMSDAKLLAASPGEARARFADFPGRTPHSPDNASPALISLLALIRSYLQTGTTKAAYAKTIAPLLAKTDFAEMLKLTPEGKYYATYPTEFAELALHVAGLPGGGAVFSGGIRYTQPGDEAKIQTALSRQKWVEGIARGIDYLTEANFPDQSVKDYLFGFGARGSKKDTVGQKRKGKKSTLTPEGAIVEFRRMSGGSGGLPHEAWPAMAAELFDFVKLVNDHKKPTFTAKDTVAARDD